MRGEGFPPVAINEFAFPFQQGMEFVAALVRDGGIAAVDRAYVTPPEGSNAILHPDIQLRGEVPTVVPDIETELAGYVPRPPASLGEFGLRQILSGTVEPSLLTQTVDGWVGDSYRLYQSLTGDAVFAYRYLGRSELDAIEVTEAVIDLTEIHLQAGNPVNAGGGILYRGNGYYVFIDRVVDELTVVISTDEEAGAEMRDAIAPPAE